MVRFGVVHADELRAIPVFSDLEPVDLAWLAEQFHVVKFEPGDVVIPEGSPADKLMVILEGRVAAKAEHARADGRTYTATKGQVTGMLPFSRLKVFPLTTRAMTPVTIAMLPAEHFPAMLEKIPSLASKLVSVMADRIRETTKSDQQREKLTALGKLSAGLAHELNNPAAAVRSSSSGLRETIQELRAAQMQLDKCELSRETRLYIAELECDWSNVSGPAKDPLEKSDQEDKVNAWLREQGIPGERGIAASLVDSGCDMPTLETLRSRFDKEIIPAVISRLSAWGNLHRLSKQMEHSAARISELIAAMRNYSYMDQAPEQEIDVRDGLENTLTMLGNRITPDIHVKRCYDSTVPKVSANGSELNQVWTNLIDNALDAMKGRGELGVSTSPEFNGVLVEVRDDGPGIPAEISDRIFEPFFTTKPVGEGMGLGLDIVYRIVRKHRGDVRVESRPGRTSFQVRIPAAQAVTPAF